MNESRAEFSVLSVPKAESGTPVEEFARIVANMHRLLSRLSNFPPFKQADLGVSEWIALTVVQRSGSMNNKQLAVKLGVTRQRAHQLINKLESAKLISVESSSADSRENIVTLAKSGEKILEALNAEIRALLDAALGPQVETLGKLRKQLNWLQRSIRDADPNRKKPEGRKKVSSAQKSAPAKASESAKPKGLFGYLGWGQATPNRGGA